MSNVRFPTVLAAIFALSAAFLCNKLLLKHLTGTSKSTWFEAGCSDSNEDGSAAGCGAVLASPYSVWPPKRDDEPEGTQHVPVAFLGLVYYSMFAVWIIGVGSPSRERRWIHVFPLLLVGIGLASSIFYTYIMSTKLGEWCPWCLATHGLNLLMAGCLVLMWPGKTKGGTKVTESQASPPSTVAYPSNRQVLITVLAILFIAKAEDLSAAKHRFRQTALINKTHFETCKESFLQLQQNVAATRVNVPVGPDDPVRLLRDDAQNPIHLILFSDFECPVCKKLAHFLETSVAKLFDNNLKMTFKHFPLHVDCNAQTKTKMHPNACAAAKMAEAARVLGGDEAFWKAHDYFFKNQNLLKKGQLTPEKVAQDLGLESAILKSAMESAEVIDHIQRNAKEARAVGVSGTPSVFMMGQRVDRMVRGEIRYWDRVAQGYWKGRQVSRPDSTKLPAPPTPDSQGQKAGP